MMMMMMDVVFCSLFLTPPHHMMKLKDTAVVLYVRTMDRIFNQSCEVRTYTCSDLKKKKNFALNIRTSMYSTSTIQYAFYSTSIVAHNIKSNISTTKWLLLVCCNK